MPDFCDGAPSPPPIPRPQPCTNPSHKRVEITIRTDDFSDVDNKFLIQRLNRRKGHWKKKIWISNKLETSTTIYITKCLPKNKCYRLLARDLRGDGLCCDSGEGSYRLVWNGKLIIQSNFVGGETKEISPTFGAKCISPASHYH